MTAVLPGLEARPDAAEAASDLRRFLADPASFGGPMVAHVSLSPRSRSGWMRTWTTIPLTAFTDRRGVHWSHKLLPRWEYSWEELSSEMLPDLEALAATGKQPLQATR